MRPLFLSHTGMLGGAELSLLDHAKFHAAKGKVLLFAPGPLHDELVAAGVDAEVLRATFDVTRVKRSSLAGLGPAVVLGLIRLARQVAKEAKDFDVICANTQKSFLVGVLAAQLARRPLVWLLHDIISPEHFGVAHRKLVVTLVNLFTAKVIANSHASKEGFVQSGGRASRVEVVHNGIDARRFEGQNVSSIRETLGIGNAPLVGIFSRLSPWKGQDVLLKALAKLPGTHALLVGGALFGEDAYEASLRAQAARLGLQDRAHFLGFRGDIPELMLTCDVIVHASVAPEPFGRVLVEGMLAEKPVVAAHAGGVGEIVEDMRSGLLVEPGSVEALASALMSLQSKPELAESLACNGRQRALETFSLQAMVQGVADALLEVVPSAAPRFEVPSRSL